MNINLLGFNVSSLTVVCVNYLLFFFGLFTGVFGILAVAIAYYYQNSTDYVMDSHLKYQIKTFWVAIIGLILGTCTTFLLIGWPILIATYVWSLIRIIKGFRRAFHEQSMEY